ncbi:MAG: triose-phosphate isomerase [Cyclobacteriaceae bacterium]|nr:triose-phosphate isomerase [Cyclobacteriaceae bacterium]
MRKKIVAGNWKMNKTLAEARALTAEVIQLAKAELSGQASLILCTPFLYLHEVNSLLVGTGIAVGAQNCSEHDSGAYTGEVSAIMIQSLNVPYVILGHSERRQYFLEGGALLAKKVDKVLAAGLTPIFCCGEPLEIREQGTHEALVKKQVEESLFHLGEDAIRRVVIAYEPVWAIGTGKTATSQQAQDMHAVIRQHLAGKYGKPTAETISILYGGSVKPDNAKELFAMPDVDGGLVGGASLKARDFIEIAKGI